MKEHGVAYVLVYSTVKYCQEVITKKFNPVKREVVFTMKLMK